MKHIIKRLFYVLTCLSAALAGLSVLAAQNRHAVPLIHEASLVYVGAFKLPHIPCNKPRYDCFGYGGYALAYNPHHHSLYVVGHTYGQLSAEISIPQPVKSSMLDDLPTATILQPFSDALDGRLNSVNSKDSNHHQIAGQLVYKNRLVVTVESTYDAAVTQTSSHFSRPLDLASDANVVGPVSVGRQYAGFVDGYMALIPQRWQQAFGGPALTGNCCLSITSHQSNGPALTVFDPANIDQGGAVPGTPVLAYPHSHPLGTGWDTQSRLFNGTTKIAGVVFPIGTRSVLFFGRQGVGPFCYGPGTNDEAKSGKPAGGPNKWCYDLATQSKGVHAFPYIFQVWAYDAEDLLAVKNGEMEPWQVKPYDVWQLHLPFEAADGNHEIIGAAYDPETQRIFISRLNADHYGNYGYNPLIHVFQVTVE